MLIIPSSYEEVLTIVQHCPAIPDLSHLYISSYGFLPNKGGYITNGHAASDVGVPVNPFPAQDQIKCQRRTRYLTPMITR